MPSSPIISVRGLGKKYILGETLRHDTFRDHLAGLARGLFHRGAAGSAGPKEEEFWALKDVSFDVQEGEVLGIIGRNGAGKSTLLKVLSRITEPTTGEVRMRGRVASLLEVGTGFHPELTGRENVFLNGAILGMRQAEIKAKFDEIVAFSGVGRFLDTPVKRYSSGMYVRLAFAVAAHLEPEILIVDEVLAVGDAEFQKKCMGKMGEVAKGGRTVLFVSHNLSAVTTLCQYGILLDRGQIVQCATAGAVVRGYIDGQSVAVQGSIEARLDRHGTGEIRFKSIMIRGDAQPVPGGAISGAPTVIEIELQNRSARDFRELRINVSVDDYMKQRVTAFSNRLTNCSVDLAASQLGRLAIYIDKMPLIPGRYTVNLLCAHHGVPMDLIYQAGALNVEEGHFFRDAIIDEGSCGFGVCMVAHRMEYATEHGFPEVS